MHPRPNAGDAIDQACPVAVLGAFVSMRLPEAGTVRTVGSLLTLAPTLVIELSLCRYPHINRYLAKVGEAGAVRRGR